MNLAFDNRAVEIEQVVVDFNGQGQAFRVRKLEPGKLVALSPRRQVIWMQTREVVHETHPDGSSTTLETDFITNKTRVTRTESPQISLFGWQRKLEVIR